MGKHSLHDQHSVEEEGTPSVKSISGPAIRVNVSTMRPLTARPSLIDYFRQLWGRRHFIGAEARAKAFQTTRDMKLGKVWLIVSPFLESALYGIIFALLLQVNRGIDNFVGYVVIGITFFQVFSKNLNAGIGLVKKNRNLIKSFMFPRASIVISQGLRFFLDTVPPMIVAVVFGVLMGLPDSLNWTILLALPLFILGHIFSIGLMFIASRVTAFYPDFQVLISLGQRAWFYGSGVFFSIERFSSHPVLMWLFKNNPAYIFLTAMRDVVLYGHVPSLQVWLTLFIWSSFT